MYQHNHVLLSLDSHWTMNHFMWPLVPAQKIFLGKFNIFISLFCKICFRLKIDVKSL